MEQAEKENVKQKGELEKEKEKQLKAKKKAEDNRKRLEGAKGMIEASFEIAKGVTKALGGGFVGIVQGAVIAAMGAVNLAKMSAQLAKMEDGGLLRGRRHAQGGMRIEGTNIEVEGGEYVVNRESTRKNVELLSYINKQRKELKPHDIRSFFAMPPSSFSMPFAREFAAGGLMPAIHSVPTKSNEELVESMVNSIRTMKIEPKVAVTDIIRVQDEMTQVGGWTGV